MNDLDEKEYEDQMEDSDYIYEYDERSFHDTEIRISED